MITIEELCSMEGKQIKVTDVSGGDREGTLHCYSEFNENDELEFYVMVNATIYFPEDIDIIEYI